MNSYNIEKLWMEYYPKVYGYFFRRVSNRVDIEDLTSITLEIFMDNILNPEKQIRNRNGFLWKIAHNQLLVFINTKSKKPILFNFDEDMDSFSPSEIMIENQVAEDLVMRKQKLMNCVKNQLKMEDVYLVEKIVMEDNKAVDVAKELDLRPENVRKKISRSLKKLRENCKQIWVN